MISYVLLCINIIVLQVECAIIFSWKSPPIIVNFGVTNLIWFDLFINLYIYFKEETAGAKLMNDVIIIIYL